MIEMIKRFFAWLFPKPKRETPAVIKRWFDNYEEFVRAMHTPEKLSLWISRFTVYDLRKNKGWSSEPVDGKQFNDLMASLAYSLYSRGGGACGNFMALYIVCARSHGFECGGIVQKGHAMAWINVAGVIYLTNNQRITRTEYKNFTSLLKAKKGAIFVDEYYKVVHNGTGKH